MAKYKWQNPYEWLLDYTERMRPEEIRRAFLELGIKAGFDEIQDMFQDAMDEDGYFESEKRPCSICGNPTEFEIDSTEAEWYLCEDCERSEEAEKLGYTHNGGTP